MASEISKTEDTGLVPSHRISELMGGLNIILLLKKKKEKGEGNIQVLRETVLQSSLK